MVTSSAHDPLIGKIIAGRYEVTAKLSQGGMGGIYLATQRPLDRTVVLKVLLQSQANNETAILRFEKEARSVSRLVHPHIVSVFDFGQTQDGQLFIAMEHLPGRSLRELLVAEGSLAPPRALHVMRGIVSGLSEAHRHGIIHRDLKPENIQLVITQSDPDFPKILDFGVARTLNNDDVNITKQDVIPGTPTYISPERLQGESGDERSDLYSLGAIWYEMITGHPPFRAENSMRVMMMHIQQTARRPSEVRPDIKIGADAEHLMMRLLAKEPNDRPPTALALLDLMMGFATEPWTVQSAREHANSLLPKPTDDSSLSESLHDDDDELTFSRAEAAGHHPTPILLEKPKATDDAGAPVLLTRKKASAPLPTPGVGSPMASVDDSPVGEETIAVPASRPAPWSNPSSVLSMEDAALILHEVTSLEQVASTIVEVLRADFDRIFVLKNAAYVECISATIDAGDVDAAILFGPAVEFWNQVSSGEPYYGKVPKDASSRRLCEQIGGGIPGGVLTAALFRNGSPALIIYAEHDERSLSADLQRASSLFAAVAGALTTLAF